MTTLSATHPRPRPVLKYSLRTAKVLAIVTLTAAPVGLALDRLVSHQLPSAMLTLIGVLAVFALFVGPWGFLANAPATALDERELLIRDRVHVDSFRVIVLVLLVALLGCDAVAALWNVDISGATLRHALRVVLVTSLALPAALWALRDQPED